MDVRLLTPSAASAVDTVTGGQLFVEMADAYDDGCDVDLQVELRGGQYVVHLHVVNGERVLAVREYLVQRDRILERHHLVLLQLHVDAVLRKSALRCRQHEIRLAQILKEKGLAPRRPARSRTR